MGDSAFIRRTRYWRAGCTQTCPSGSGGGGWIPLQPRGWPPTSSQRTCGSNGGGGPRGNAGRGGDRAPCGLPPGWGQVRDGWLCDHSLRGAAAVVRGRCPSIPGWRQDGGSRPPGPNHALNWGRRYIARERHTTEVKLAARGSVNKITAAVKTKLVLPS